MFSTLRVIARGAGNIHRRSTSTYYYKNTLIKHIENFSDTLQQKNPHCRLQLWFPTIKSLNIATDNFKCNIDNHMVHGPVFIKNGQSQFSFATYHGYLHGMMDLTWPHRKIMGYHTFMDEFVGRTIDKLPNGEILMYEFADKRLSYIESIKQNEYIQKLYIKNDGLIDFNKSDLINVDGWSIKLEDGNIRVWKLCRSGTTYVRVQLEVPAHARRIPFIPGCFSTRVESATVISIMDKTGKNYESAKSIIRGYGYTIGHTITAIGFNPDYNVMYAPGLHVYKFPKLFDELEYSA